MLKPIKKIKDLGKKLDQTSPEGELKDLKKAIMEHKPDGPSPEFSENLKKMLINKHGAMQTQKTPEKEKRNEDNLFWKDSVFKRWVSVMAVFILFVFAGIISYPMIPAPTVKGYLLKGASKEISYNAPIKLTFSQMMNKGSVEENLMIEPDIEGDISWSGNTLVFTPKEQFKVGDSYKVTVGKEAKSIINKKLKSEYFENYQVVEAPKILLMTPNDGSTRVPSDAVINVMFDRPINVMTTLAVGREMFPDVIIEPSVEYKMKWLGTSAFQIIPKNLNLATNYTVTIPDKTEVLDGGFTEEAYSVSFDTIRPILEETMPLDTFSYADISSESSFLLTFNQKIDLESAEEMIELTKDNDKDNKLSFNVKYFTLHDYKAMIDRQNELYEMSHYDEIVEEDDANESPQDSNYEGEDPTEEDLFKSIIITPIKYLDKESSYTLSIKEGLKAAAGPLTMKVTQKKNFTTLGDFKWLSFEPNNETANASPQLTYSNPINISSLKGKIKISPATQDEEGKDVEPDVYEYGNRGFSINYDYKPSTDYKITIDKGISDVFGNTIADPQDFEFKTPAYKEALSLEQVDDISVLNSYRSSLVYAKSVNIDFIDVKLKKLENDQFFTKYAHGYIDYNSVSMGSFGEPDYEDSVDVDLAFNERGHTAINLDKIAEGKLASGFYYIELSNPNVFTTKCTYAWQTENPGCEEVQSIEKAFLLVSDTALTMKESRNEVYVWATDLKDGSPVSGYEVTVLNDKQKEITSGITDFNGVARMKIAEGDIERYPDYLIVAEKGGDVAFVHSNWSEGIAPYNFNISSEPQAPQYYMYLYTDRPIYRPAQEVFFKGILRQEENYKFKNPDVKKVQVRINDPSGAKILDEEFPLNDNGTFNGKVTLGGDIRSGDYYISAKLIDAEGPNWYTTFDTSFKVYEYRKPEYKIDLSSESEDYLNGEEAVVDVAAGYFFGAPLKNAEIKWTLRAQDYYFILPEELVNKLMGSWFSFAEEGYFCYFGCKPANELVSQGQGETDLQGNLRLNLPLDINDKKMSQIYTLEVTVSDANNQTVSNRISFPVHKGEVYVGIRSQEYVVSNDKPAKFDVLTVDTDGKILSGENVKLTLYERNWNTIKRKNVDGGYYFENTYEDKEVESTNAKTGENGIGTAEFNIKDGGVYKVEASLTDRRGNEVKSATTVYVSGSGFINWGIENNDRIELIADKMEYQVGETAKVLIKSPYKDVYALVTYEKDKVLEYRVIKLTGNSDSIEVPISDKMLPNVFVSVVLVKGSAYDAGLMEPAEGGPDERSIEAFKVGYTTLQVNTDQKRLNIDIESNKDTYAPGENVTLNLKTTDFSSKAVATELSVAVIDESVLSLTESVTADLLNVFYRERLLGVSLAQTLTKALSRVNVQVEAGMKGGGGGELAKRGVFKDMAHFESVVNTDQNGEAKVEFTLPDNLTSWQVMAIGISKDSQSDSRALVGSNTHSFVVNKDILVRPVLPRFTVAGDQMTIKAIVHNYMNIDQNIDVKLEAEGVEITDSAAKNVFIPAEGSREVLYNVKVSDDDIREDSKVKFLFTAIANGGERGDTIEISLPVKESTFPETVALGDVLSDQSRLVENVWLPNGLNTDRGYLKITVTPTLAGAIEEGMHYLVRFPYGCTEQITSSILPNIAVKKLYNTNKFTLGGLDIEELNNNVNSGLQKLNKLQKSNGSFGIWSSSKTNNYLTAYVAYTMIQAKEAGYTVDDRVYNKLIGYLQGLAKTGDKTVDEGTRLNTHAYILYVLSEADKADVGLMNVLYEDKDKLSLLSRSYLAMAYNSVEGEEDAVAAKVTTLKKELENSAIQTPRGVEFKEQKLDYSLFDTNTRTSAVVMQALNRLDQSSPLIPKALQSLLKERQGGHFMTTQETAVSLIALIEYLDMSKELSPAYEGRVSINNEEVINQTFTSENIFEVVEKEIALSELLPNNMDNEVSAEKIGNGKMYMDMNLFYYLPLEEQKAEAEGIEIVQEYFAMDDEDLTKPLETIAVAENIHARMTLIVPENKHYVMVEDFLPAGLEGIDFNLKTSEQGVDMDQYEECFGFECYSGYYFNYSEIKDDRVMYFADYLPKGVYEIDYYLRATSVGVFADLPAMAQETYFPEVFGRTKGGTFEITE